MRVASPTLETCDPLRRRVWSSNRTSAPLAPALPLAAPRELLVPHTSIWMSNPEPKDA